MPAGRRRWRHSIKARLVALFVLLALLTTLVFVIGMQRALQGGWQAVAKPLVADYVDRLAAEIGSPPDENRARAIVARLPISLRIDGPVVRFDSHPDSHPDSRHDGDESYGAQTDPGNDRRFGAEGWGLVRSTADGHRLRFGLSGLGSASKPHAIGWTTLGLLLTLTTGAFLYVRRLLRPLDAIGDGVERFGRGDFAQPITTKRHDELGALAERINTMATSLHGMLDAKRALLLAISHELRSPLTRARVNAELVDESEARTALLRDLGEMRDLITDLLESERLADGHRALLTAPVDVAALVHDLVVTRFAGRPLTLHLDEQLGPWPLDAVRIRLLLRNLIDNALRHGGAAAQPPEVFARRDGQALQIGVRDHGPGVAADQRARLGDAFYRPDSARTRAEGGVGLGLHLCRLVAQAHGGSLEFRDVSPGLEVVVRLPA